MLQNKTYTMHNNMAAAADQMWRLLTNVAGTHTALRENWSDWVAATGWSESSQDAHVILYILWCSGSF